MGSKAWLGLAALGLLAVLSSACTRDNPAFGDGEGDGDGDGPDDGNDSNDGGSTIGGGSTRGGGEGSAEGEASSADATSVADTSASGPDGGPSSDGDGPSSSDGNVDTGTMCALDPAPYHGLESDPPFDMLFEGCPPSEFLRLTNVEQNGTEVTAFRCFDGAETCPCDGLEGITLFFNLEPPLLPDCIDLWVQLDSECGVLAYSISPTTIVPPLQVVSNVLHPDIPLPPGLQFELAPMPTAECEGICPAATPHSHYALVHMPSGIPVPPNGNPVLLPTVPPYAVTNEQTGYDASCDLLVSWQANDP